MITNKENKIFFKKKIYIYIFIFPPKKLHQRSTFHVRAPSLVILYRLKFIVEYEKKKRNEKIKKK